MILLKPSGTKSARLFQKEDILYLSLIVLLCCLFFHTVLLNPAKMLYYMRSDLCRFLVPKVTFLVDSFWQEGALPLWEPLVYSGKPPYGVPQLGVFYPFFLFVLFFSTACSYGYLFAFHYVIGGAGMYFFVKEISGRRRQAFLSSLIFAFSGYASARVLSGQYWHLSSIAWIPFIFFFAERVLRKRSFIASVLLGGSFAMQFLAGHTQYFFYTAFILLLYLAFRFISDRGTLSLKQCAGIIILLAFSGALFFLLSGIQMLPALEYSHYVYRANMYSFTIASDISLLPSDLFTLVFPNIRGSAIDFSYWGIFNFWEVCTYMGLLPLMLVFFSLFLCRNRYNSFFLVLLFFSLLFSMGRTVPIFSFCYYRLPGFNLFRCPSRMLAFYAFSFAIVAGYGFSAMCDGWGGRRVRRLMALSGVFFGILLIAIAAFAVLRGLSIDIGKAIIAFVFNLDQVGPHTRSLSEWQGLVPVHYELIRKSLVSPWQCANLVIALMLCMLMLLKRMRRGLAFIMICSASMIDLWSFGMPMIQVKPPQEIYRLNPTIDFLLRDRDLFRLHDCSGSAPISATEPNGIFRIEGFESIFLNDYIEYLTCIKFDEKRWLDLENFDFETRNYLELADIDFAAIAGLKDNLNFLDLLNVKYVISNIPLSRAGMDLVYQGERVVIDDNTRQQTTIPVYVYQNENSLPRAFVVRRAVLAGDREESLKMIKTYNPREVVVLTAHAGKRENPGEYQEALITKYSPNRVEVSVDLDDPGFLVLSEVWYPGWKAVDNGANELRILKVNHCLRGAYLEPGIHRISFIYRPASFIVGRALSIIGLALFSLSLILSLLRRGSRGR